MYRDDFLWLEVFEKLIYIPCDGNLDNDDNDYSQNDAIFALSKEPLDKIKLEPNTTKGVIAYCYVDHEAGISLRLLSTAIDYPKKDKLRIRNIQFFKRWNYIIRGCSGFKIRTFGEGCSIYEDFAQRIKEIDDNYFINEAISNSREIEELDDFRHPEFVDDIQVTFIKEGIQSEVCWVRIEDFDRVKTVFKGELLNEPNADFGVHLHDMVEFEVFSRQIDEQEQFAVIWKNPEYKNFLQK